MKGALFTIGHSNHETEIFLGLLQAHGVTAVADVRSRPYSRYTPQFSREALKQSLKDAGLAYVFLGEELGARSDNPDCYREGRVQFDLLAREPKFAQGLERVLQGMETHRLALMCSEKDPIDCHRALLVARKLFEAGAPVVHIHADGSLEQHEALETRLLAVCKLPAGDLFTSREEFINEAYAIRSRKVAYLDETCDQVTG